MEISAAVSQGKPNMDRLIDERSVELKGLSKIDRYKEVRVILLAVLRESGEINRTEVCAVKTCRQGMKYHVRVLLRRTQKCYRAELDLVEGVFRTYEVKV